MALEEHMRQKQRYTVEMQEQEKQAFLEDQRVMQGFAQLQNASFQASSKKKYRA